MSKLRAIVGATANFRGLVNEWVLRNQSYLACVGISQEMAVAREESGLRKFHLKME